MFWGRWFLGVTVGTVYTLKFRTGKHDHEAIIPIHGLKKHFLHLYSAKLRHLEFFFLRVG